MALSHVHFESPEQELDNLKRTLMAIALRYGADGVLTLSLHDFQSVRSNMQLQTHTPPGDVGLILKVVTPVDPLEVQIRAAAEQVLDLPVIGGAQRTEAAFRSAVKLATDWIVSSVVEGNLSLAERVEADAYSDDEIFRLAPRTPRSALGLPELDDLDVPAFEPLGRWEAVQTFKASRRSRDERDRWAVCFRDHGSPTGSCSRIDLDGVSREKAERRAARLNRQEGRK